MSMRTNSRDATDDETYKYAEFRIRLSLNNYIDGYYTPNGFWDGGSSINVVQLALDIVQLSKKKEKKESTSPNPYKIQPNRAFRTSKLVFGKLRPYKMELKRKFVAGELIPDPETLYIWYLEHLLNIALEFNWYWAAIAILKVLFILDFDEFEEVVRRLNYSRQGLPAAPRRLKGSMIDELEKWFRSFGIKKVDIKVGSKIEKHFERLPNPADSIEMVAEILKKIRPLKPLCTLHEKSGVELLSALETLLQQRARKDFDNEAEMEIMQFLTCPQCLFGIFEALQFSNWPGKLGLPIFIVTPPSGGGSMTPIGGGGGSMTPMNKGEGGKSEEGEAIDVESELERREERQRNMSLDSVLVVSDNGTWLRIGLDQQPRQIFLHEGDSLIEIRGEDEEGSLPLDYHQIEWDPDLDVSQPYMFITNLKGGRNVELTVKYQRDSRTHELTSATVDITYTKRSATILTPNFKRYMRVPESLRSWKAAAAIVGAAFIVGVVCHFLGVFDKAILSTSTNKEHSQSAAPVVAVSLPDWSPQADEKPPVAPTFACGRRNKPAQERQDSLAGTRVHNSERDAAREESATPPVEAGNRRPQPTASPSPGGTAASATSTLPPNNLAPATSNRPSSAAGNYLIWEEAVGMPLTSGGVSQTSAEVVTAGSIAVKVKHQGEEIEGARLALTDRATGEEVEFTAFNNEDGYSFSGLKLGSYDLRVEKEGFGTQYRDNIEVKQGETALVEVEIERVASKVANRAASVAEATVSPSVVEPGASPRVSRPAAGGRQERTGYGSDSVESFNSLPLEMRLPSRRERLTPPNLNYRARGLGLSRVSESVRPGMPGPAFVEIDSNQPICVSLVKPLNSSNARAGQIFKTNVVEPVYVGGVEAIPSESIIMGSVSQVRSAASSPDGRGMIAVHFTSLYLPDGTVQDIEGRLRGYADEMAADSGSAVAATTTLIPATAPRISKRKMVFVGDEEKEFRIVPLDEVETPASPKSDVRSTNTAALPNGVEAFVSAGTRVCLSLERKVRLPLSN